MIIQEDETVGQAYARLLAQHRAYSLDIKSGDLLCVYCNNKERDHLPDKRCTCAATSLKFHSRVFAEADRVEKTLELIEELYKV